MLRCNTGEVSTSYQTFVSTNSIGQRQPPVCLGYNFWEWVFLLVSLAGLAPLAYFTINDMTYLRTHDSLSASLTVQLILFYLIVTAFTQLLHGVFWLRQFDLFAFELTLFMASLLHYVDFIWGPQHTTANSNILVRVIVISVLMPISALLARLVSTFSLEFHIIGASDGLILMYKMYCFFLSLIKCNMQMNVAYGLMCLVWEFSNPEPTYYSLYAIIGFSLLEWAVAKLSISKEMKCLVFSFVLLESISLLWIPIQAIWLTHHTWTTTTACTDQCLVLRYSLLGLGTGLILLKVITLYSLLGVFRNFGYGLTDRAFVGLVSGNLQSGRRVPPIRPASLY